MLTAAISGSRQGVSVEFWTGLRDETLNSAIGGALMKGPFAPVKRLRRDSHEPGPACWLHGNVLFRDVRGDRRKRRDEATGDHAVWQADPTRS